MRISGRLGAASLWWPASSFNQASNFNEVWGPKAGLLPVSELNCLSFGQRHFWMDQKGTFPKRFKERLLQGDPFERQPKLL